MERYLAPSEQSNKDRLRAMFEEVFISSTYSDETVDRYFTSDYVQSVDGKVLHLERFRQHIRVQKEALRGLSIEFKTLAGEGDVVFSNHIAKAETIEGRMSEIHVIAEFRFRDGRVMACDELSHMVSGHEQDRDLGSRH
jgi:hypothetical protein